MTARKPCWFRFAFSLRTLFVVVALASLGVVASLQLRERWNAESVVVADCGLPSQRHILIAELELNGIAVTGGESCGGVFYLEVARRDAPRARRIIQTSLLVNHKIIRMAPAY